MNSPKSSFLALVTVLLLLGGAIPVLHATTGQHGLLTYREHDTFIEIVSCEYSAEGEVIIPPSINDKPVTVIGDEAFYDRWRVRHVALPDGVTTIGDAAFQLCGLISISLPDSVTTIGRSAFEDCGALASISIPTGVTSIAEKTFYFCRSLKDITIPERVTSIGPQAFSRCRSLLEVTIPESVISIGAKAFEDCRELTEIIIPQNVSSVGDSAFSGCIQVESFEVHENNAVYLSDAGVLFSKDRSSLVAFPAKRLGEYVIPDGVTSIAPHAFSHSELGSITIPGTVDSIGFGGFAVCTNLTSMTIPHGVTEIADVLFYECYRLESIVIPETVTSIGRYAFGYCRLKDVTIPSGVTSIGGSAFFRCEELTSIVIPEGVTSIGDSAFSSCTALVDIIIPDSVSSIGSRAFSSCYRLGSVSIPEGVLSIEAGTFAHCTNLASVTIPDTVRSVGREAFFNCKSLPSVAIPPDVTSIEGYAFTGCDNLTRTIFHGNVPDFGPFWSASEVLADGTTIYYFDGSAGFTTPTWEGFPSVNMGSYSPIKPWLLENGHSHEEDITRDLNGDGVPLLLAYALDLDPNARLAGKLPQAVAEDGNLLLEFFADAEGVIYIPETSTDLADWTSTGVLVSEMDEEGRRTASLPFGDSKRFLRLRIEH